MNNDTQILQRIDDYLNGLMSEDECRSFESEIDQNPELQTEVEQMRIVNKAIYVSSLSSIKDQIASEIKNVEYKPPFNYKKYLFISAFLMTGLFVAYIQFHTQKPDSQDSKISTVVLNKDERTIEIKNENTRDTFSVTHDHHTVRHIDKILTIKKIDATVENIAKTKNNVSTESKTISTEEKENVVLENEIEERTKQDVSSKIETAPSKATTNDTPCVSTHKLIPHSPCKNENNGRIEIKGSGISKIEMKEYNLNGQSFNDIPAGEYIIVLTYGNDCIFKEKISLAEKWCASNEAYSFNPDYETWELQHENGMAGNLVIFNNFGKEVYSTSFGDNEVTWVGRDQQGISLPMGTYVAFVNYTDGKKERIELTIIK